METGIGMLLVGIFLGFMIGVLVLTLTSVGTLKIIQDSEDEPPYLFLELNKPLDGNLAKKKFVHMKVSSKNHISHQ